jgi:hypothetical protein
MCSRALIPVAGKSLTGPSALRSSPPLTIFNSANEKDAFAAGLTKTQDPQDIADD